MKKKERKRKRKRNIQALGEGICMGFRIYGEHGGERVIGKLGHGRAPNMRPGSRWDGVGWGPGKPLIPQLSDKGIHKRHQRV